MNGIQEIFFYHAPANKNVNITIKDERSEYTAIVDYEKLIYALKEDLELEVKE
jgi:hypothetical protein